jgi:hypothetical protein
MVDPRLLTRVLACALAAALSGCIGVHIGPVAGRVVDEATGKGVPGVEMFRTYPLTQIQVMGEVGGRGGFTPDWSTSGPAGEFSFPGRWVFEVGAIDHSPLISWIHRDFGWAFIDTEKLDVRRLVIRLRVDHRRVEDLRDQRRLGSDEACNVVDDEAYQHCKAFVAKIWSD